MSGENKQCFIGAAIHTGVNIGEGAHRVIDPQCLHLALEALIENKKVSKEFLEGLTQVLGFENQESLRKALVDINHSGLAQEALAKLRKKLDTQLVVDYLQNFPDLWKPVHNLITPVDGFLNICGKGMCAFDDSIASAFASSAHKVFPNLAETGCKKFAHAAGPVSVLVGGIFIVGKIASASDQSERKKQAVRGSLELGFSTIGAACGSLVPIPVVGTTLGTWVGSLIGNSIAKSFGC